MTTKTKNIILWSIIGFLFVAAIVLGTIYDLQISKSLADLQPGQYYTKNLFAIIGESVGENILYILLVCAVCILFFYLLRNPLTKKWLNVSLLICLCFVGLVICFYCLDKTLSYISTHTNNSLDEFLSSLVGKFVVILSSIIVLSISGFLFSKVNNETLCSVWKWALLVIILAALSNGIVQGAKHIFDRTRYRAMVYVGDVDFQYYNNWFIFNDNKFASVSPLAEDFFKSFPSGHTCAAASSFFLVCLPLFLPQTDTKKWKTVFWTFAGAYTSLVALSRIIAGAHFFMDVFVGGSVTIVLTLITYFYLKYKLNKKQTETTCMKRGKRTAC